MVARIYIAIPCLNRRRVVEQCLPTIANSKLSCDYLDLWNDGSTEYGPEFLKTWADGVEHSARTRGIQTQRKAHLTKFWSMPSFTHIYFGDSDAFVDPNWRSQSLGIQAENDEILTCLYNTKEHTNMPNNVIDDDPKKNVILQRYAPGISYLLTRAHVARIMPVMDTMNHFDWLIPSLLGHRCAISRVSHVDHIGFGGERHPKNAGLDGGDRATSPTPWLVAKRAEIVEELSK